MTWVHMPGQARGDDAGIDRADDERGDEGPENGARAAKDGRAAEEDRGEGVQELAFGHGGPEVRDVEALDQARQGREAADDDEGQGLDPVDGDAHEPRAVLVVADRIDVRAEAVPVQEEPDDDRDDDREDELHRDLVEDAADEQVVHAGALRRHQRLAVAAADDEHDAAEEELRRQRRHERWNANLGDDDAVEEPRAESRRRCRGRPRSRHSPSG